MTKYLKTRSFDSQPYLQGQRIALRPLQKEDFEALYAIASDPLLWEQHPERNRYQRDVFVKFFEDALASQGALVILDQVTQDIIGSSRYYEYSFEKSEVAVGYTFLSRKYWGGEVNSELKELMLRHGFQYVKSVVFYVGAQNMRSRRALEKIGAVLESQESESSGKLKYRIMKQVP